MRSITDLNISKSIGLLFAWIFVILMLFIGFIVTKIVGLGVLFVVIPGSLILLVRYNGKWRQKRSRKRKNK